MIQATKRGFMPVGLFGLAVALAAMTATGVSYSQQSKPTAREAEGADEHMAPAEPTHWMLKVDDKGNPAKSAKGGYEWVRMEAPKEKAAAPKVRTLAAANEAEVNVNCRTPPTNSSGRKSCDDDEVHHLPPGWVFAQNEVRTVWHSDIGSENYVNVGWADMVEVAPGSGYMLPSTMTVHGHARSGGGQGERGHTDATVYCRFFHVAQ